MFEFRVPCPMCEAVRDATLLVVQGEFTWVTLHRICYVTRTRITAKLTHMEVRLK